MAESTYLRQLALGLKVDGDISGLLKFDQKLQMFVTNLTTSAPWKLVDNIGRALTDLSVSAARDATQLDLRAKSLRTTTQELQRLEYVAGSAGIQNPLEKVGGLMQRLRGLETSAGTTAGGGSAGGLLGALGIRRDMDPAAKIAAIATNLQRLPPVLQNFAKSQLGLDEFQHLLEMGPDQIKKLAGEADNLGLVWSDSTIQAGRQLEGQLFQLRAMQTGLTRELQADLVPIALRVVGVFKAWAPVILDLAEKVLASFGITTGTTADAQRDLKARLEETQAAAAKFGEKLEDTAQIVVGVITALKILLEALVLRAVISQSVAALATLNGAMLASAARMVAMKAASAGVTAGIGLIIVELQELYAFMNDKPNIWSDMLEDPGNLGGQYIKWLADLQEKLTGIFGVFKDVTNAATSFVGLGEMFYSDERKQIIGLDAQLADPNITPQRRRQLKAQLAVAVQNAADAGQNVSEYMRALPPSPVGGGAVNVNVGGVNQQVTVNGAQSPGATAAEIQAQQRAAQDQQLREAAARTAPIYRQ